MEDANHNPQSQPDAILYTQEGGKEAVLEAWKDDSNAKPNPFLLLEAKKDMQLSAKFLDSGRSHYRFASRHCGRGKSQSS